MGAGTRVPVRSGVDWGRSATRRVVRTRVPNRVEALEYVQADNCCRRVPFYKIRQLSVFLLKTFTRDRS